MKIILTGGGTAGHVTPNLALLPALRKAGYEIEYIGGKNGIEKELAEKQGLSYHGISSGKLRRYLSRKNISDIFRVCKGVGDALTIIKRLRPDIIFSKGGFVSVPVVMAGKLRGVPVVIHESDITPGLANKIALRFADVACVSFPETAVRIGKKAIITGTPIRGELLDGSRTQGLDLCGFDGARPVLLVMGGSLGSVVINKTLRQALPRIIKEFDVIHICGKGNIEPSAVSTGYYQTEYAGKELSDLYAACDIVAARAGANSIFEFLALKKPNLLIPLSKNASRGDQIENAISFKKQNFSNVLFEEDLTADTLLESIQKLYANRSFYIDNMNMAPSNNGITEAIKVIRKMTRK